MKIRRIRVYEKRYELKHPFVMSGGKVAVDQDSTIVQIETDDGQVGWGEHCAFSPNYLVGHGAGARAAMTILAPAIIGYDPRQTERIYDRMNGALMGHAYAKSAIDIACWDLLGQSAGLRISDLLGGTYNETFPLYSGVSLAPPAEMGEACRTLRAEGYRRFQVKVGTTVAEDIERANVCVSAVPDAEKMIIDANGVWSQQDAVRAVAALDDLDVYIEQPCQTIEQCAAVRARSSRPFILDESLYTVHDLFRAHELGAMDAVLLKLSRFGGITPIRKARDLCLTWGIAMTIEDSGGADIVTAAMAHLTASTPPRYLMNGFLVGEMLTEKIAVGGPEVVQAEGRLSGGPGLGITVDESGLGSPWLDVSHSDDVVSAGGAR
jgi:L-alanine-DL-glutamate epimerase-like enolase superfamily enzyme